MSAAQTLPLKTASKIQLEGFEYVQLRVGNAYQTMHFFRTLYGFAPVAYSGLETGNRNFTAFLLGQGKIRLLITTPSDPSSVAASEINLRGDGVSELAFRVANVEETYHLALSRGAVPLSDPSITEDDFGNVMTASILSGSGVVHSFVQLDNYSGAFVPGFKPLPLATPLYAPGLLELDHVALSLPQGELDKGAAFYTDVLDMTVTHQEDLTTPYSAMGSKVVQNQDGTVKFSMMEPRPGQRTSQIEEYLKYNHGPGVQHLAFSCSDIVNTVQTLMNAGVEFLAPPPAYYDLLPERVGAIGQTIPALRDVGVLADRDEWGYLLQIFSKAISSRPTLFMEIIQREGSRGFGSGNIRALFVALEREQALRGNL